ncbi:MAG TPA: hypothetical protein VGU69_08185 [Rhizomicrobium sp.]|nr:hypothetical protein [Rhizomicrobium sp.]
MSLKLLLRRWIWLVVAALVSFAVLYWLDQKLKAETGFGTVDLQGLPTGLDYKRIFAAWIDRPHAAAAGFNLGFDYLFMLLYGTAFYYSAIVAREAFAPKRGTLRRVLSYLAIVPVLGAVADAAENAFQFWMLNTGATDAFADAAARATGVKDVCFIVGLLLLAAAVPGYVKLVRPVKEQTSD